MPAGFRDSVKAIVVCGIVAASGLVYADEPQDSPLYAYTLQKALERMESETTLVTPPQVPETGDFLPEPVQLQAATSQPIGPTVCHPHRTVCPERLTACPPSIPTICPQRTTSCPAFVTQCPAAATTCPELHTRCPGGATNCPVRRTACPQLLTACPPQVVTACPLRRTACPERLTACPSRLATVCPQATTNCPAQTTHCPFATTQCPNRGTFCPALVTQCPPDLTRCPERLTACPRTVFTSCPQSATECPVRDTICPSGYTNCPIADTMCPVRGTVCPGNCPFGSGMITIIAPTGDPTISASAELSFDANIPGVLVVYCQMTVNAPNITDITSKVRVCIDGVGTSVLQWQRPGGVASNWLGTAAGRPPAAHPIMGQAVWNAVGGFFEVSAVFTGMPDSNRTFGPKRIYAQIVDNGQVVSEIQQPIEVFFDRDAVNNPGTGPDAGPNWFYYWKTDNVVGGSAHDWQYEDMAEFGYYMPGEDHVNIGDLAQGYNTGPETYSRDGGVMPVTVAGVPGPNSGRGPYCCAEVVAHEGLHKWIYEVWRPLISLAHLNGGSDNGDPYDDPDGDGVPNFYETLGDMTDYFGVHIVTDPNDPDTYNLGDVFGPFTYQTYGDQELRCRALELNIALVGMSVNPYPNPPPGSNGDWSHPGWNTVPQYPP